MWDQSFVVDKRFLGLCRLRAAKLAVAARPTFFPTLLDPPQLFVLYRITTTSSFFESLPVGYFSADLLHDTRFYITSCFPVERAQQLTVPHPWTSKYAYRISPRRLFRICRPAQSRANEHAGNAPTSVESCRYP
jgi:hypothetical protein